jgi:small subunit ribosomal protein S19e
MATIYDAEPMKLIEAIAKELEKNKEFAMPEWAQFVKTGVHVERPPTQENWWYLRSAALLRTIYKDGPVGVSKLRTKYGGSKNRGRKPNRFRRASGKIIRTILQQLETLELVKKAEKGKGRIIAPKGQALLDNTANLLTGKSKKAIPKTEKKAPSKEAPKLEKKVEVKKK